MKHLKIFYSLFVIIGVLSLVGYSIINPTNQKNTSYSTESHKNYNQTHFHAQGPNQNYYHINLNEAFSIQPMPNGRYAALMPVQGGAAWFVIGEPVMAQSEAYSAPAYQSR